MKLKQLIHFCMIALFVVSIQNKAIHFTQHTVDEISECKVCEVTENSDLSHQNSPTPVLTENVAIETKKSEEKIVLKASYDYSEPSSLGQQIMMPTKPHRSIHISLAFNATAPPYCIS